MGVPGGLTTNPGRPSARQRGAFAHTCCVCSARCWGGERAAGTGSGSFELRAPHLSYGLGKAYSQHRGLERDESKEKHLAGKSKHGPVRGSSVRGVSPVTAAGVAQRGNSCRSWLSRERYAGLGGVCWVRGRQVNSEFLFQRIC